MTVLSLLIALVVLGVIIWLINAYLPVDANIKKIISIVGVVIAVLFVAQSFGLCSSVHDMAVPQLGR